MNELFRRFSHRTAEATGTFWAFILAAFIIIVWLFTGPIFNYSDTWQLVINTSTTIVTFLMVFIIQNTQNRDTKTLNLKIDELIKVHKLARNTMIELDELSDEQLDELQTQFDKLATKYQSELSRRRTKSNS